MSTLSRTAQQRTLTSTLARSYALLVIQVGDAVQRLPGGASHRDRAAQCAHFLLVATMQELFRQLTAVDALADEDWEPAIALCPVRPAALSSLEFVSRLEGAISTLTTGAAAPPAPMRVAPILADDDVGGGLGSASSTAPPTARTVNDGGAPGAASVSASASTFGPDTAASRPVSVPPVAVRALGRAKSTGRLEMLLPSTRSSLSSDRVDALQEEPSEYQQLVDTMLKPGRMRLYDMARAEAGHAVTPTPADVPVSHDPKSPPVRLRMRSLPHLDMPATGPDGVHFGPKQRMPVKPDPAARPARSGSLDATAGALPVSISKAHGGRADGAVPLPAEVAHMRESVSRARLRRDPAASPTHASFDAAVSADDAPGGVMDARHGIGDGTSTVFSDSDNEDVADVANSSTPAARSRSTRTPGASAVQSRRSGVRLAAKSSRAPSKLQEALRREAAVMNGEVTVTIAPPPPPNTVVGRTALYSPLTLMQLDKMSTMPLAGKHAMVGNTTVEQDAPAQRAVDLLSPTGFKDDLAAKVFENSTKVGNWEGEGEGGKHGGKGGAGCAAFVTVHAHSVCVCADGQVGPTVTDVATKQGPHPCTQRRA